MLKCTMKSGKVINMRVADAYNEGGVEAAKAVLMAYKMAMGNDEIVNMEYIED